MISPLLFSFFVRDFPTCSELTTSFADDFTVLESGVSLTDVENRMNSNLQVISNWASRKGFSLSAEKSSVTLFTTDSHQHGYHPHVFLNSSLIPLEKNPKILGVTFDPQLTFGPHAKTVVKKVATRLRVLKALAGTDWGHDKEDLLLIVCSVLVLLLLTPVRSPSLGPGARPSVS